MPKPSAAIALPITGLRSRLVISPTAFTWPAFSAINAITAGSTSKMKVRLNDGAWNPTTPVALSLCGGKPNQSASLTGPQLTRSCVVTSSAAASNDVIWPNIESASHDST